MALGQSDHDFTGYIPTAIDPGWIFTGGVIAICLGMYLLFPFALRLGRCLDPKRRSNNCTEEDPQQQNGNKAGPSAKDVLKSGNESPQTTSSNRTDSLPRSPGDAGSCVPSVAASNISRASSTKSSTVLSAVASSVLDAMPRKRGAHRRFKKPLGQHHGQVARNRQEAGPVGDDSSVMSRSVMSRLELDAVSVQDAVDAGEGSPYKSLGNKEAKGWKQVIEVADWDAEMCKIVKLSIPYSVQGMMEGVFQIISVAVLGHLIGVQTANAFVVVTILVEFSATLTYGFREAIGVLCPQADGAGNNLLVGRYLQLGILCYVMLIVPSIVIWVFFAYDAILWFGFDDDTAQLGQDYVYPYLFMVIFDGINGCMHEFLDVTGKEKYCTIFQLFQFGASMLAVTVMALSGITDLVLIGVAQAFIAFTLLLSNFAFVTYMGWLDDYWQGLAKSLSLKDGKAVRTMVKTAIPLGVAWLLTYGEWELMTVFVSHMGPAEVAVWGILGFLWDSFEQLIEGLSSAAFVRVGFRMGAGQPVTAKAVAYKSLYLSCIVSVFSTGVLFIIAEYLPVWLTPDPTMQGMIFELIPLMGFGQILLSAGTVCWSIVGAQGRLRLATSIEIFSSWGIVIPISSVFVYVLNWNLLGQVGALVFGYTVGGLINLYLIMRSDWKRLSDDLVLTHSGEGVSYDEYDWDDLPPHIRDAADLLGYNQKMWDADKEPETNDKDWAELSREEKNAAKLLGFSKKKWDKDDEDGKYDGYDFDELPKNVVEAAQILGYTKELWDNDEEPPTASKAWNELSSPEQEAAKTLGYNQRDWDSDATSDETSGGQTTNYDDIDWKDLPVDIKAAAQVLGYNEKLWNTDGSPPCEDKYWQELSAEEQQAATAIGYNKDKWNNNSDAEDEAATSKKYDDLDWKELPEEVKAAAKVLGYTKKLWNSDGSPPCDDKDWEELSSAEQRAATVIGYDRKAWDDGSEPEEKAASATATKKNYDDLDWKELPEEVKAAAEVLGYTKKLWNSDGSPPCEDKDWEELSSAEQRAATVIGYDRKAWDGGSEPEEKAASATATKKNYDDLDWKELPEEVKAAAKILGYTKKLWNSNGSPPCDDKDWEELSSAEQRAATVIGYDRKAWDGGSEPEEKPASATATKKNYDDLDWKELPEEVKAAAEVLGYTKKLWNSDGSPPSDDKDWNELGRVEKEAAGMLGYTQKTWDSS